jgi:hypothetical protein
MTIKERIKNIETYFKEMQIVTVDEKQVIYVVVNFPNNWVITDDVDVKYNVTVSMGSSRGEYYFCTEIDNGEDEVFNAIDYNIEKMKEAIERAQLLAEKTKELRSLFEDESISIQELRNLKIDLEINKEKIVITKPNKNDKTETKNE